MFNMGDAIFHLLFPGLHFLLRNVDPRRVLLAKECVSLYVIVKFALRARAYYAINGIKLLRMQLSCLFGMIV